jgi:PAS domain S-box-containing protein
MRFDHPDAESAAESVADSGVDATERDRRGLLDVLIESSPVGLAWLDRELRYLRVNAALAELDGVTAEEHLGRTPEEVAPDLAPLLCEQMRHVVETGEPVIGFEVTGSAPAAPGVAQKRLASYYPIRGDGGATIGIGAVVTDITAGRASDRQRRLSELRYKMLADSVPQIVWTAGPDGAIDYYNDRWFEYSGLSREDPDAWDWERGLHPDDVAASRANWRASVETRREHTNEARFRRHDGQYRWFLCRARPVLGDNGAIEAWFGTCLDIDERKRAEAQQRFLSDASKLLGSSLDYEVALDAVARLTVPEIADWCAIDVVEGGLLRRVAVAHADPARAKWGARVHYQWPAAEDRRIGAPEVLHSGRSILYARVDEDLIQRVAVDERHRKMLHAAGLSSAMLAPVSGAGGPVGVISFVFAESGRRYDELDLGLAEELGRRIAVAISNARAFGAEHAARAVAERAEHRVRFLSDASRLLFSSLDYDKNIKDLARTFVPEIADWCAVDVVEDGVPRRIVMANGDPARERATRAVGRRYPLGGSANDTTAVIRSGVTVFARRVTDKMLEAVAADDAQLRLLRDAGIVSWLCMPMTARGRAVGALTLLTAESGRELGDEQVALAQEVAGRAAIAVDNARLFAEAQRAAAALRVANQAKDEFLGLVSHELRTPITTIFGNAQVLQSRYARLDDTTRTQALSDIEQEAERLRQIIDNMLVLSRLDISRTIETEPLIVERVVRRIAGSFRERHRERPIEVDSPARVPPVAAEPVYFEQVLRNLLSNADKYSPPRAPIVVRVREGDGEVMTSVLDRGQGIEPEEAQVIFRAFFRSPRTAGQASGAGIGLTVCKRLVEAQGGRVWARSRNEGGAEFGFALPVEQEAKS